MSRPLCDNCGEPLPNSTGDYCTYCGEPLAEGPSRALRRRRRERGQKQWRQVALPARKFWVHAVVPVWAETPEGAVEKLLSHTSRSLGIRRGAALRVDEVDPLGPGGALAEALRVARERLDDDADAFADVDIIDMLVEAVVDGWPRDDLDPALVDVDPGTHE